MVDFVHLHSHTSIGSMQDAMTKVGDMFKKAKELGQPAMAITDHGTMAAVLDARKASNKTGVKYIPGLEAYFVNSVDERRELSKSKGKQKKEKRKHLVLLAKNEVGYRNLLKINYIGFRNYEYIAILGKVFPVIDWSVIEKYNDGIVCLTACGSGPLAAEMFKCNEDGVWDKDQCDVNVARAASRLKSIFGDDLYLEVQPHSLRKYCRNRKTREIEKDANGEELIAVDQEYINTKLIRLSRELGIKAVATCDVHYLEKEDAKAHDMLMAINEKKPLSDKERHRYEVEEFYVKSGSEVFKHFANLFGAEIALELCKNSVEISNKCEDSTYIGSSDIRFPLFDVKDVDDYDQFRGWVVGQSHSKDIPEDHLYMRYKCIQEFKRRFSGLNKEERDVYKKRMIDEIKVFETKNFSSYMLITADFINEAKKNGIRVGSGRGCLTGDAFVLTTNGYVRLRDIKIGDTVYSHTGKARRVLDTHVYDVSEDLLEIDTDFSFETIKLTGDHKVFAKTNGEGAEWVEAKDLRKGDFVFMPFLSDGHTNNRIIDLINNSKRIGIETYNKSSALGLKETLLRSRAPSSVVYNGETYKVECRSEYDGNKECSGYFALIKDIQTTHEEYVYDISVEEDASYITSNFAVHNSVGGSMVAYLLGIHIVDPIEYDLLFERFLNAEKTAFPDIDSDFPPDGRDWVEKYIINKYGNLKVAHVSNLSTMTPKVVIKDVARSLELGGSKAEAFKIANKITDVVPDHAKTFEEAVAQSPQLAEYCRKYPDLERYGKKLVGLEKVYATHAAGIIISDVDLDTYAPLRYDKNGTLSLQYEKNRCESEGLIKMDLLGLEHLKVIDSTIKNARLLGMDCPEPEDISLHDTGVWNMISKGHTLCVFQMGSDHMRSLCRRIKPKKIEDLSLVNALGRPSADVSRGEYMLRRDGKKKITYKFECLEEPLKDTLGICVYEEQLAKLAKHVSGWDLKKADGLRKLTKMKGKDPKLAAKLESDFVEDGMVYNSLSKGDAESIWKEIVEPFAGYGFNKAHGIFYSFNGYHTAYYKYHYPAPFMAAVLKSEIEKPSSSEEKIKIYKKEAKRMGIKVVSPNVNDSETYFSVLDDKTIVTGLAAVKGVGVKAVENIIKTRNEHPFVSFADFLYRTKSSLVKSNVIQALAKAGCFDVFGITRKSAFTFYSDIRTKTNKYVEKKAVSGASIEPWELLENFDIPGAIGKSIEDEWTKKEILQAELESLGEYVSGGYNDIFDGFFMNNGYPLNRIKKLADGTPIRVELIIDAVSENKTKSGKNKGNTYGSCSVSDLNGDSVVMKVWSNTWKAVKNKIMVGRPLGAVCRINIYNGNHCLILDRIERIME